MYKKFLNITSTKFSTFYKFTAIATLGSLGAYYGYKYYKFNKKNDFSKLLWIETDLEPDDVLSIDILQKKNNIYAYVCGEGNVTDKMNRILNYYGNSSTELYIEGMESDKDFPEPFNIQDIEHNLNPKLNVKNKEEYIVELTKFSDFGGNKMVIIKPPRELYNEYLLNPEKTKKLMSQMNCYMYGSFNLRSLKTDKEKLKDFLNCFKTLYIFETHHAIGSANTVNLDNFKSYSCLQNVKNFKEISKQWNDYIVKDCKDTCNSIINKNDETILSLEELPTEIFSKLSENQKARYHRNYKCYKDVSKYNEYQFVMADVGLALCFDKNIWVPVNINFDEKGYTKLTKAENSNVYTVFNTPTLKNELLEDLEKMYS
jgi:hypothetical protein